MYTGMTNSNLLSRCGIYCGGCYVYLAYKEGGGFLDSISEKLMIPKDEIRCEGCTGPAESLWRNCRECRLLPCLEERGYEFCFECPEFEEASCDKYEGLSRFCLERGEDIRASMRRIGNGGADAWLREQDRKWRCSQCGEPISWYEETCHHCGEPI